MLLFTHGIFCSVVVSLVSTAKDLPPKFPHCYRNDPKLSECLLKATETVRPFLRAGVPELNLPALEPFYIPEINLKQGTNAVNVEANLKNIVIHGLGDYLITKFDFDVPNLQFFADAAMKHVIVEGDYTVKGKILLVPIEGNGKFTASVDNTNATIYQKVELRKKNGLDYLYPTYTNTTLQVARPKAHLDGLFNGNEEFSKVTQKAINDNIDELFLEVKPVLEEILTNILEDLLLKAFEGQVPFNQLYPIKQQLNNKLH